MHTEQDAASLHKLLNMGDTILWGNTFYKMFYDIGSSIVKDVPVKIKGYEVLTNFMILDMGEEDDVHLVLGRPSLLVQSSTWGKEGYTSTFQEKRQAQKEQAIEEIATIDTKKKRSP